MEKYEIEHKIHEHFRECFDLCTKKRTIWRCKHNIPVKDCKLKFKYKGGCEKLELYINGETIATKTLYPGEEFEKTYSKLTSIDIYCKPKEYYVERKDPCNCLPQRPKCEPCCCHGEFIICTYKKCKPKKIFALELILFLLLVIVFCACRNRYYPIC